MTDRFFRFLGRLVTRHAGAVILFYVLLALISIGATAAFLQLKTDQNDLVATDLEYNQRYLKFLAEFGDLEFLYVVTRVGEDPRRAMAASDAVAEELHELSRGNPENPEPLIQTVLHRVPPRALRYGLPLREYDELRDIVSAVERHGSRLEDLAGVDGLAAFFRFFARMLRPETLGGAPDGEATEGGGEFAKIAFRVLEITVSSIEKVLGGERPASLRHQFEDRLDLSPQERGYLTTENGKLLLIEVSPYKDLTTVELIEEPLRAIRAILDRVRERFPDVEMGLTGRPVLQADEMMTTDRDMRIATILALAGVLTLFVLFFRRLRRPFLSVLTLVISISITFGIVTVTYGYLTLLSIVFTAMLVGLGIDFGIHFLARYQDELLRKGDIRQAISTTLVTTGKSVGTGAVTTAAAFFTILLVDFQGLRELGFIAGAGVLVCFLGTVTLLPAMICVTDTWSAARRRLQPPVPVRVPLLDRLALRPRITLAVACALSLLAWIDWRELPESLVLREFSLPYSSNLIELQAQELESVEYEKLLLEESDFSTWFGAFIVESEEGVHETLEELEPAREAGIVGETKSVLDYVPQDQERKLALFARAWERVRDLEFAEPSKAIDRERLGGSLESLLDSIDTLASAAVQRHELEAAAELDELGRRVDDLAVSIETANEGQLAALAAFQHRWFGEIGMIFGELRDSFVPETMSAMDLPYVLRRHLVSTDGGHLLVYAYPKKDIWEGDNMEEFVTALRQVDPDVTGPPIQVYESSWRMHQGFIEATLYALLVTLVFLLLDLRSVRDSLLAMVPLVIGLLWLLESLPYLGLTFNLANFFALPILIGCGIDGGIHILHRFRESRSARDVLRRTCSAVTLSFLTTMAGFGAMSFAMHRGVRSLGHMMVAGLTCILIASIVLLPAVLRLFERQARKEKRLARDPAPTRQA